MSNTVRIGRSVMRLFQTPACRRRLVAAAVLLGVPLLTPIAIAATSTTAAAVNGAVPAWATDGPRLGDVFDVDIGANAAPASKPAMQAAVDAALHDWLTWRRPNLIEAWEQYQYMRHLMVPAYQAAGLPESLLFGILAKESGGRVHAVSRVGAAGPLQFMPGTGARFGLTRDGDFDQRFDPTLSARANVAYLNERFAEHGYDLALALAAYNGGEGRVRRLAGSAAQASFWNDEIRARLPRETQDYVPGVLAAAILFEEPERFGLRFPDIDATPGQVSLTTSRTLGEIAICLGQAAESRTGWFRVLRNLNPRLEPFDPLPPGTLIALPAVLEPAYRARCTGEAGLLAARLHASRDDRRPRELVYTVRRGDTLSSIARNHRCGSATAIARDNGISAPRYLIRPGQQLRLSGCSL